MHDPKADSRILSERLLNTSNGEETTHDDPMLGVSEIIVDPLQAGQGPRGESQTPEYKDGPFALAFIAHLLLVLLLAVGWGIRSLQQTDHITGEDMDSETSETLSLWGILTLLFLVSIASVVIAAASLDFMTTHAEHLIQVSLMASCITLGVLVVLLFANNSPALGMLWLIVLIIAAIYAYSVQSRIAFASANLRTALEAIQTNYGVCMLAYAVAIAANLWILIWIVAFIGVAFKSSSCINHFCHVHMNPIYTGFLILSYYWTSQVLQNTLHVTVAGVIGTWVIAPQEARTVLSPAILDSFSRATSYSFGSICFGSLLVAIIETLEQLVHNARRHGREGFLLCLLECLLVLIQRLASMFTRWSFVYIGLYGYDYLSAGKKVIGLFQERGWTTIINDNLVRRLLLLVCLVTGALTGLVGMTLAKLTGWADALLGKDAHVTIFLISCVIGMSLASILMGVVMSGVDSVIVCFAEAPAEFQRNHPALTQQMTLAWQQVYPQDCHF